MMPLGLPPDMAFELDALRWLIPTGLVTLLGLALTFAVFRAAPTRSQNRRLAVVLLLEALVVFAIGFSDTLAPDETGTGNAGRYWGFLTYAMAFVPVAYLFFLATLDSPFVQPLKGPVLLALLPLPPLFIYATTVDGAAWWVAATSVVLALAGILGVSVYSIAVAVSAYRRAPAGSAARTRAKAYATAFIARDALVGLFFVGIIAENVPVLNLVNYIFWYVTSPFALIGAIYLPLLAYGILKTQLFDIDLKIKKGIMRSTLLGFFLIAFFIAEQVGQAMISERAGPFVGLAGAGLLAVAISPLRKAAKRIADAAMPATDASESYMTERKRAVYKAALEGAFEDGVVTDKERAILTHLAAELGLGPQDMLALEEDAARASLTPRKVPEPPVVTEG